MNIIVMGPQGSGKSTQAKLLAQKLGLISLSSGEVARQISSENTDEARQVKAIMDRGELIPDEILFARMRRIFDSPEGKNGFVLDGYPRNNEQLVPLEKYLQEKGIKIDKVILIDLPEEIGISRIMSRVTKEGRSDDTPEAIARRLQIFHEQTKPILDYYQKQGIVNIVDGSGTIEEVTALINKLFQ